MLALQVHFEKTQQNDQNGDGRRTGFVVKHLRDVDDVQHDKEDTFKKRWATLIKYIANSYYAIFF